MMDYYDDVDKRKSSSTQIQEQQQQQQQQQQQEQSQTSVQQCCFCHKHITTTITTATLPSTTTTTTAAATSTCSHYNYYYCRRTRWPSVPHIPVYIDPMIINHDLDWDVGRQAYENYQKAWLLEKKRLIESPHTPPCPITNNNKHNNSKNNSNHACSDCYSIHSCSHCHEFECPSCQRDDDGVLRLYQEFYESDPFGEEDIYGRRLIQHPYHGGVPMDLRPCSQCHTRVCRFCRSQCDKCHHRQVVCHRCPFKLKHTWCRRCRKIATSTTTTATASGSLRLSHVVDEHSRSIDSTIGTSGSTNDLNTVPIDHDEEGLCRWCWQDRNNRFCACGNASYDSSDAENDDNP